MKKYLILLFVVSFYSCSTPKEKGNSKDTLKSTEKIETLKNVNESNIDNKKITGIWTDGNSENATFDIRKDSIYYVEQFKSYKYSLTNDSIKIHYPDFTYSAKIYFLKDTLVMDSKEDGIAKFWKFKK